MFEDSFRSKTLTYKGKKDSFEASLWAEVYVLGLVTRLNPEKPLAQWFQDLATSHSRTEKQNSRGKVMKSFIPSTCGCVHLQHMILCTWEASPLTLGCTKGKKKKQWLPLLLTLTHRWQAQAVFAYLCISTALLVLHVFFFLNSCKHHKSYSPGSGETKKKIFLYWLGERGCGTTSWAQGFICFF